MSPIESGRVRRDSKFHGLARVVSGRFHISRDGLGQPGPNRPARKATGPVTILANHQHTDIKTQTHQPWNPTYKRQGAEPSEENKTTARERAKDNSPPQPSRVISSNQRRGT